MGSKYFPSNYREYAPAQSHILDNLYIHEKHNFITATKSGIPSEYNDIWTVYAPIVPLVEFINIQRENLNPSEPMIKIMCDSGQGKTKVCLCIIPLDDDNANKKAWNTYAEGEVLAKGGQYSGINKCIMCFCAPAIKKHY